jgi:hypothetical protein
MPREKTRPKRRRQTYVPRQNAVHVTLYHPHGEALPKGVAQQAQDALLRLAMDNGLLIGVATT